MTENKFKTVLGEMLAWKQQYPTAIFSSWYRYPSFYWMASFEGGGLETAMSWDVSIKDVRDYYELPTQFQKAQAILSQLGVAVGLEPPSDVLACPEVKVVTTDLVTPPADLAVNPPKPRPTFPQVYMQLAHLMSQRSTCSRGQVGAVITSIDYRHVYAVGYNGSGAGLPNGCLSDKPGLCAHLHAEENACINCTVPSSTPKIVFTTHMPCYMCAQRLINLGGVRQVYYAKEYRLTEGLEALRSVGIPCEQLVV